MAERRTWKDFTWPEWVPAELRKVIEEFWLEDWGRGPDQWEASARDAYNDGRPLGERGEARTLDSRWVTGRFVHTWNNMAAMVLDDGTFEYIGASDFMAPEQAVKARAIEATKACARAREILSGLDLSGILREIGPSEDRALLEAALPLATLGGSHG